MPGLLPDMSALQRAQLRREVINLDWQEQTAMDSPQGGPLISKHMNKAKYLNTEEKHVAFMCIGCGQEHAVPTKGMHGWSFNQSLAQPTLMPSVLVRWSTPKGYSNENPAPKGYDGEEENHVCHSFVTDGKIQYLDDCTHQYKGQTIELPEMVVLQ